jgi:hypothetical protein
MKFREKFFQEPVRVILVISLVLDLFLLNTWGLSIFFSIGIRDIARDTLTRQL